MGVVWVTNLSSRVHERNTSSAMARLVSGGLHCHPHTVALFLTLSTETVAGSGCRVPTCRYRSNPVPTHPPAQVQSHCQVRPSSHRKKEKLDTHTPTVTIHLPHNAKPTDTTRRGAGPSARG
jgi:hypothetical protein